VTAPLYRGVPDWTQGTATATNGSRNVSFTGAGLVTTDPASGLDYWAGRSGDFFVVDGVGYGLVTSVIDQNTIQLATAWSSATQTNVAYRIVRMSQPATGEVRAAIQQLLKRGDADSPFVSLFADDSTARLRLDPHSGAPGLYVGPSGAADAALKAALQSDPATGAVSFPNGVKSWSLTGFRNRLRNASFGINQRGVSGTVTLAAGAYGHDGVKAGAAGCTYTFATSGIDTTITITAGSLILAIESSLIEGGAYVLSQAGNAQARVWQGTGSTGSGSYAAVPAAGLALTNLAAATQTNVEFSTGTVLRPQFEPGSYPTAFERRLRPVELLLAARYYGRNAALGGGWGGSAATAVFGIAFPVPMRATPTTALVDGAIYGGSVLEINTAQHVVSAMGGLAGDARGGRFAVTTVSGAANKIAVLEAGAVAFSAEI
jgi:hypothetical protein